MFNTRNFTAMSAAHSSDGGGDVVEHRDFNHGSCEVDRRMLFGGGNGLYGLNCLLAKPSSKPDTGVNERAALVRDAQKIELSVGLRSGHKEQVRATGLYCFAESAPEEYRHGLAYRHRLILPSDDAVLLYPDTTRSGFGLFRQGLGLSVPQYVTPSGLMKEMKEAQDESEYETSAVGILDGASVQMPMFGGVDVVTVPVTLDGSPIGHRTFVDSTSLDKITGNMMRKSANESVRPYTFSEVTGAFQVLLEDQRDANEKTPYTFLHARLPNTLKDTLDLVVSKNPVTEAAVDKLHKKLHTLNVPLLLTVFWSERSKKWFYIETISDLLNTNVDFIKVTRGVTQDEYHNAMKQFAELHGKNASMDADLTIKTLSYNKQHLEKPHTILGKHLRLPQRQKFIHSAFTGGDMSMTYQVAFTHDDSTKMLACEGPYIPAYQKNKKGRAPGSVIFVIEKDCGKFSQGKIVVILYMFTWTNYLVMTAFDIEHELFQMQWDRQNSTWRLFSPGEGFSKDARDGIPNPTIEFRDIHITAEQILANTGIDADKKKSGLNELLIAVYENFKKPASAPTSMTVKDIIRNGLTDAIRNMADGVAETLTIADFHSTLPEMFKRVNHISELDLREHEHLARTPTGLFLQGVLGFKGLSPVEVKKMERQVGKVHDGKPMTDTHLKLTAPDTPIVLFDGDETASLLPVGSSFLGVPTPLTVRGGDSDMKHARDGKWTADRTQNAVLKSLSSNGPASQLSENDEDESGNEGKSSDSSQHDSDEDFEVSDDEPISEESAEEEDLGDASDGMTDEENEGEEGGGSASNGAQQSPADKRKRETEAARAAAATRALHDMQSCLRSLERHAKIAKKGGQSVDGLTIKQSCPSVLW